MNERTNERMNSTANESRQTCTPVETSRGSKITLANNNIIIIVNKINNRNRNRNSNKNNNNNSDDDSLQLRTSAAAADSEAAVASAGATASVQPSGTSECFLRKTPRKLSFRFRLGFRGPPYFRKRL